LLQNTHGKSKQLLIYIPLGLAVGDSLGSTSEFEIPSQVGTNCVQYYSDYHWPSKQVGGGIGGWDIGDPTDDTDMAMAILRSYVDEGNVFNPVSIARYFVYWKQTGPWDIGATTFKSLSIIEYDQTEFYLGGMDLFKSNPNNAANGSLMRNGIIPFLYPEPNQELLAIEKTVLHSIITHFSPLCVICCVIQTLLVRNALVEKRAPTMDDIRNIVQVKWQQWKRETKDQYCLLWLNTVKDYLNEAELKVIQELEGFENEDWYNKDYTSNMAYVVLTLKIALWSAYWSFREDHPHIPSWLPKWVFKRHGFDTIMWVALIGGDADTYCSTAGPLLGALHPNINNDFLEGLKVKNEIIEIFSKIYESKLE